MLKISGYAMNRQGKSRDAIEERMQSVNKVFWKDILICKSQDVPWKVKCQRLVDHVYAVFTHGSQNWSWTIQTLDRIKRWETKTTLHLFRFKRHEEETWVDYRTRTCDMAVKILPFSYERSAESMWPAMRWACDEKSNPMY